MPVHVLKLQVLTDRDLGPSSQYPLFYCHTTDRDHDPRLAVERADDGVVLRAADLLFKVKANPQTKNRVDIYMSLETSAALGAELRAATVGQRPRVWRPSRADPRAAARGAMQLPVIHAAWAERTSKAFVRMQSGLAMDVENGYLNVDVESPDPMHIRMTEREVHLGMTFAPPSRAHDSATERHVVVPVAELQRPPGRPPETNPVPTVSGTFAVKLSAPLAAGLGELLATTVHQV